MISKLQIKHISRFASQKLISPTVGIVGGYHGANLGDMALGYAVKARLKEKGVSSGLQTIYNLEKWPSTKFAIIGGGAVGYIDSLIRVYNKYKGAFSQIAFLGVDFNDEEYPDFLVEMFKAVPFLSCRSEEQAVKMKAITGRKDILFHPDIAYSLIQDYCRTIRTVAAANREKILLVNALPLYGYVKDGRVLPTNKYRDERPELYKHFEAMHANYMEFLRNEVESALKQGYAIHYLSFAPLDEKYGRLALDGLPVHYQPYHDDPFKMIRYMSSGAKAITTRYHATIFAIKLGIELSPIAYAKKNEFMLQSLGFLPEDYISVNALAEGKSIPRTGRSKLVSPIMVDQWETEAIDIIDSCINAILHNS